MMEVLEEENSNKEPPVGGIKALYSCPKGQISYSPWPCAMTMAMTIAMCDIHMKQQACETTCLRNTCDLRHTISQSHCSKCREFVSRGG